MRPNQAAPTTGAIFKNTYDPGETTVDTGKADFDLTKTRRVRIGTVISSPSRSLL